MDKSVFIRREYLWSQFDLKVGIPRPEAGAGLDMYTMRNGESPFEDSLEERWMYRYLLYKVAESFNVTFKEWMKQPIYMLERNIEMIRRATEAVAEAAAKAAEEDE